MRCTVHIDTHDGRGTPESEVYTYSAAGRLQKHKTSHAYGESHERRYYTAGRLVRVEVSGTSRSWNRYAALRPPIYEIEISPYRHTTRYRYDERGRRVSAVSHDHPTTTVHMSTPNDVAPWKRLSKNKPSEPVEERYQYDGEGRLASLERVGDYPDRRNAFFYRGVHLVRVQSFSKRGVAEYEDEYILDAAGRPLERVRKNCQNGPCVATRSDQYQRDERGRLVSYREGDRPPEITLTYDANGRIEQQNNVRYLYDAQGRVLRRIPDTRPWDSYRYSDGCTVENARQIQPRPDPEKLRIDASSLSPDLMDQVLPPE